jgi:DNA-binding beta-propeller fold protein YncE
MKNRQTQRLRIVVLISLMLTLTGLSSRLQADTGSCGGATTTLPFTDVMGNVFFCQIASAYFSGLTSGTTATTYSPTQNVTREQMAAFITRTMDQSLKRGSRRAVAKKWFNPQDVNSLTLTDVGSSTQQVEFDGTDLWVANFASANVMRIRPSDGKLLDTWTGALGANGIVAAMGRIFVTGRMSPGSLYMIDPTQPPGAVTTLTSNLGNLPIGIAFDGSRIWTANHNGGSGGSVSIVSLNPTAVTTVSTGFNAPIGMLYDGSNIWTTDQTADTLLKLNSDGSIAQTINVGDVPGLPVFDGTNIWVPNGTSNSVSIVRAKDAVGNPLASAFVLATLTGNGLNNPLTAAFDGERILVTNQGGTSVSLWKAADLTPLGSFPTGIGTVPFGACSDGLNFWITLFNTGKLARF